MKEGRVKIKEKSIVIDTAPLHYKVLNEKVHQAIERGYKNIILENVCGQRYIGDALKGTDVKIVVNGVPGNDLAAFMDGPTIIVKGNAQDGVGNTMNAGEVVIYGHAGDIVGHSMRGGRIFIRGDVGYRTGLHMKAYKELFPVIIVGGTSRDFLGEYMAGGLLVVLGLYKEKDHEIVGDFVGTGMHGGSIFMRGYVDKRKLGKEVEVADPSKVDIELLTEHLNDFCNYFALNLEEILNRPFIKLYPYTHRPYGKIYAY